MKGNNHAAGSHVYARLIAGIFVLFTAPLIWADAAIPPPTMQQAIYTTPNGRTINGYDFGNGFRARVQNFVSQGGHYGKTTYVGGQVGGVMHGTKKINTLLTDTHGATARGTITTTTQIPRSALNAAVGTYVYGSLAGSVLNSSNAQNAAIQIGQGNYTEGALSAAASFDVFGIGSGLVSLKDAFVNAQNQKTAGLINQHQQLNQAYEENKNFPNVTVLYWNDYSLIGNNLGLK